jgi:hypothetical protein
MFAWLSAHRSGILPNLVCPKKACSSDTPAANFRLTADRPVQKVSPKSLNNHAAPLQRFSLKRKMGEFRQPVTVPFWPTFPLNLKR